MLKRFRQEKAVWVKYGAFLLRRGKAEASHRVMKRALECLPKKERENNWFECYKEFRNVS